MRDDDYRDAEGLVYLTQQLKYRAGGVRVERACGLVAQEVARVRRKRSRDGDALLLAAGELRGIGVCLALEADELQQLERALLCLAALRA